MGTDLKLKLMPLETLDGKQMSEQEIEDDVAGPQVAEFPWGNVKNHQVLFSFALVDGAKFEERETEGRRMGIVSGANRRMAGAKVVAIQRGMDWRDKEIIDALRGELAEAVEDEREINGVLAQQALIQHIEVEIVRAALVKDDKGKVVTTLRGKDLASDEFWNSADPLKAIIAKAVWAKYPTGQQESEAPTLTPTGPAGNDPSNETAPNMSTPKSKSSGTAQITGLPAPSTGTIVTSNTPAVGGPGGLNGQVDSNKPKNTDTLPTLA